MNNKKIIRILCLALVLVMALSGCTQRSAAVEEPTPTPEVQLVEEATPVPTEEPAPTSESTPEPTAEPTAEPAAQEPTGPINPLTGESLSEDISAVRPIAVMFNNHVDALPQCGISSADIIYEMPEEGITRMVGIFAQLPDCDRLGSIRSCRPYHADVALSYDAIYVHWGRSEQGANFLWNHSMDDVELNQSPAGDYAYRDWGHTKGDTAHTGFIKIEKLRQFLSDKNWRTEHNGSFDYHLQFADDINLTGGTANTAVVAFAGKRSTFTYNASAGGYQMAEYGVDYIDGDTNVIPAFRNVLILRASMSGETSLASIVLTNTEGTGYFCCDGNCQEITWKRGDYGESFQYFNADGSPLTLGVGKTYICVISYEDNIDIA